MMCDAPRPTPVPPGSAAEAYGVAPDMCADVLDAAGAVTAALVDGDTLAACEHANPALADQLLTLSNRVMELDNRTGFMANRYPTGP